MIKKLGLILSAAALVFTFAACNDEPEQGYKTVKSETCDFRFDVPSDWDITYTDGMLSAIDKDSASKANVVGFSFNHGLDQQMSSFEYWNNHYEKQLSDTFGQIEVVSEEETEFRGQKVTKASYVVTIGEEKFDCDIILVLNGYKVYTLTLTQGANNQNNADNYVDYSKEFTNISKTFEVR